MMVPVVRAPGSIVEFTEAEIAKKWDSTIVLRDAEIEGKPAFAALIKFAKLPRRGADPVDDDDKYEVHPAWLAKRCANEKDANCTLQWLALSVVTTFGAHHSEGTHLDIPVFSNPQAIKKGGEVIIFARRSASLEIRCRRLQARG